MLIAVIAGMIFTVVLIVEIVQRHRVKSLGTVYISMDNDEFLIYLESDVPIEELAKHKQAIFQINARDSRS